jgi:hypothetical protein
MLKWILTILSLLSLLIYGYVIRGNVAKWETIFIFSCFGASFIFYCLSFFEGKMKKHGARSVTTMVMASWIISFLSIHCLFLFNTWPINHEIQSFSYRAFIHYHHFLEGDYLPFWSQTSYFGMGSPMPLYYHKLFSSVVAYLFFYIDEMKASVILSLMFFMNLGSLGMYKALQMLELDRWITFLLSLLPALSGYLFLNAVVRGAMAEYIAYLIVPWLFHWILRLYKYHHFQYTIIPIMLFLYLAHSMIALISVYILILACLIYIKSPTAIPFWNIVKKSFFSASVFMVLISVYLFPMIALQEYYHPSKILTPPHTVEYQIGQLIEKKYYLYDYLGIFVALILFNLLWVQKKTRSQRAQNLRALLNTPNELRRFLGQTFAFTLLLSVCFLILQSRMSLPIYKCLPGLLYLQFPWRLLGFLSISLLLFFGVFYRVYLRILSSKDLHLPSQDASSNMSWKHVIFSQRLIPCLLFLIFFLNNLSNNLDFYSEKKWYPYDIVNHPLQLYGGIGEMMYEYSPSLLHIQGAKHIRRAFILLSERGLEIKDNADVRIRTLGTDQVELTQISLWIEAKEEATVILPFNYSGMETATYWQNEKINWINLFRTQADPRIRMKVKKGTYRLDIQFVDHKRAYLKGLSKLISSWTSKQPQ